MTVALSEMPVPVQVAALTTPSPKHRRRGRVTMWIAISWLAFISI